MKKKGTIKFTRFLNQKCQSDIADSGTLAVALDLRPLSFADNQEEMVNFAEALFRAGQTVPCKVNIDRKSYLSSHQTNTDVVPRK